jgi:hypothetical protein
MIERVKLGNQTPSDEFLVLFSIIAIPVSILCIIRLIQLWKEKDI